MAMKLLPMVCFAALLLVACQTTVAGGPGGDACNGVSMPEYRVHAPDDDVTPELARFAGVWHGQWQGQFPTCLVVAHVQANGLATLVYGWPQGHRFLSSTIQDGTIRFGREFKFVFAMTDGGEIEGVLTSPSGVQYVTLRKSGGS